MNYEYLLMASENRFYYVVHINSIDMEHKVVVDEEIRILLEMKKITAQKHR